MRALIRGRSAALLGCVAALGGCAPMTAQQTAPSQGAATQASGVERAARTLAMTRKWLGRDDGTGLYRERIPARSGDHAVADEWPFSQVHIGVLDLASVPGGVGERYLPLLEQHRAAQMRYWIDRSTTGLPGFASRVGPPLGPGGDLFYDDNAWVGLAAMQHWLFHRDEASLDLAKSIFTLIRAAWDRDPAHPSPGGLFWAQQPGNFDRNTVSNMPSAQLALRLYEATRDRAYLDEALRYYEWTNRTLQRPDGLYLDHLDLKGEIDRRIFTYNQGVPVGVNVLLYKATGEQRYLAEARRVAEASYDHFITQGRIDRHSMPFNAIYFKNLLLLEAVTGGTRYRDAMRDYAARMWRDRRDPMTGLFVRSGWSQGESIALIDQGAMTQIFAVLAWDPADHPRLF